MIHCADFETGMMFFTCDECPICEGWEHRLQCAKEGGYAPQFEYCYCDKIGTKFLFTGYCGDAWKLKQYPKRKGQRRTGRAYRRDQTKKKKTKSIHVANTYGYFRNGWTHDNGKGEYLKHQKHSHRTVYYKGYSNRLNRRNAKNPKYNPTGQRGAYKREFDYWWSVD